MTTGKYARDQIEQGRMRLVRTMQNSMPMLNPDRPCFKNARATARDDCDSDWQQYGEKEENAGIRNGRFFLV